MGGVSVYGGGRSLGASSCSLRCSSPAVRSCTAFLITRDKEGCNGHKVVLEIFGRLRRGLLWWGTWTFTVYHDFCAVRFKDGLHEFKGKAAKAVPVQHHHSSDTVLENKFQKGLKAFPLEVEPAGDVAEDSVGGVGVLEQLDLPLEVSVALLLGAADPGVEGIETVGCLFTL